jgi:four helix bundle protein
MRDFRQIRVWLKAHESTLEIYKTTATFPCDERYGLTSQLRRAVSSIPANIAEGYGRGGDAELARFLQIGMGSAYEVEYHTLLARDLQLFDSLIYESLQDRIVEVKRMLAALLIKVRAGKGRADSRQQTADGRRQTPDSRQQTADSGRRIATER